MTEKFNTTADLSFKVQYLEFQFLTKNNSQKVDIENHLSKVRQIDQKNHTNRAEALSSLISSLNPAHVKFLLCLQDSAPPPETPFPFQFGTLHPKFQPFAKKEYQKGVFSGTREEIEHLTLDIINSKNVPYRQLAAHFKTDASSALREGNVVGWVEKSLFKGEYFMLVFSIYSFF